MFVPVKRFDPSQSSSSSPPKRPKVEHKVTVDDPERDSEGNDLNVDVDPKYEAVFSRFRDMLSKIPLSVDSENRQKAIHYNKQNDNGEEEVETHDLVPLSMPEMKSTNTKTKTKTILQWMTVPVYVDANDTMPFEKIEYLSGRMVRTLHANGFDNSFAVQTQVIPEILKTSVGHKILLPDSANDVLVNAHTGSGKTLAYGVPIIESLSHRIVPQIRALILVPTKPLIQQVRSTLESLAKGTSLRVMALRADRPFKQEQRLLETTVPDILIATPGRLVDHLRAELSLAGLRYLVIDEADRLLNQSFQGWVDVLMESIEKHTPRQGRGEVWHRQVQKLVFSATLTRDPGKLASLRIYNPKIFVMRSDSNDIITSHLDDDNKELIEEKNEEEYEFSVPDKLKEMLVQLKSTSTKPLKLVQLLLNNDITTETIVFAKSSEAASRLARLIALINERLFHKQMIVEKCTGELNLTLRKKVLRQFSQGEIGVLVCTDLIARGIDISAVKHVINYDLPVSRRDYVHRVGRTARAGNEGTAWSLVSSRGETKYFWSIVRGMYRKNKVDKYAVEEDDDEQVEGYQQALQLLENEVFNRS